MRYYGNRYTKLFVDGTCGGVMTMLSHGHGGNTSSRTYLNGDSHGVFGCGYSKHLNTYWRLWNYSNGWCRGLSNRGGPVFTMLCSNRGRYFMIPSFSSNRYCLLLGTGGGNSHNVLYVKSVSKKFSRFCSILLKQYGLRPLYTRQPSHKHSPTISHQIKPQTAQR